MLTLASVFRNATGYIDRYAAQVRSLNHHYPTRVVAVFGDSHDRTGEMLFDQLDGIDAQILRVDHGGPEFGPMDLPQRWRQMGAVCNVALAVACRVTAPADQFCYMESDLIWHAVDVMALIADLTMVPAVSPLSIYQGRFYDTWGFTKDGVCFERQSPYHPGLEEGLTKIDTSGSCFVTSGEILPALQFSPVDCIRGIGRSLVDHGYGLWLDPNVRVTHP